MRLSQKSKVAINSTISIILAFGWSLITATLPANATCTNPGQEAAVAAAQQAETSSPVVTVIETCGGDDISYQIPLSVDVTFDGQVFEDVYVTTNSVITFGRPDGTYWDYPQTPSISLYSTDWVVYPGWRDDEHLIISSSDGGFQVDISARPIWLQNTPDPTNITITAAILSDGTVAMAYTVDGPTYDGQTRTGVRLNDGTVVTLDEYGVERLTESPTLSPEPTTESPFVPEPTASPTVSPEPSESPTASPQPSESPTVSPEPTSSPSASPEPTPEPTTSPEPNPEPTPPYIPEGATVYSEGQVAELVAPQGQRIASILGYYGDPNNSRNGLDVSPVLSQFAGSQSAIINANSELFTDPAPGTVKIMILLVTYEPIPVTEPTDTPSPEPTSTSEPLPTTSPEAPQITPTPEPSSPEPSNPPTPSEPTEPEPTIPTQPEPQPEVAPTPEPTQEPQPEPEETLTPTPSPSDEPEPEPEPSEPSPTPEPSPEEPLEEDTPSQGQEETSTPEPSREPEESASPSPQPPTEPSDPEEQVEIKQEISSDNIVALTEELASTEPTELTATQVEAIQEAALEVFNSGAEQGSPEYEAALDALLVVAQADDIVIDEELASAPVIGAAVVAVAEAFNALGNAGADMSPQVREQSEKVVIAAVIVGQVAMTAVASATSAASVAARRP